MLGAGIVIGAVGKASGFAKPIGDDMHAAVETSQTLRFPNSLANIRQISPQNDTVTLRARHETSAGPAPSF